MSSHLSPIVMSQQARAFHDAARREHLHAGSTVSIPAYFLAARAIELGLKAFLVLRGDSEGQLKAISHDLARALDRADSLGFRTNASLLPEHESALRWVNGYYAAKSLEYLSTGFMSLPQWPILDACALAILDSVQPLVRAWMPPV